MTIILHIIAVVCIIIITACATSLWHDITNKHEVKISILGGTIVTTACTVFTVVFVWLLFLAPTSIY